MHLYNMYSILPSEDAHCVEINNFIASDNKLYPCKFFFFFTCVYTYLIHAYILDTYNTCTHMCIQGDRRLAARIIKRSTGLAAAVTNAAQKSRK